ncbi:SAM-dependent methyltransferase [Streptomyces buecherae]|uniref:SAM-dependent methyltransferase n=1 Tax=Streptomyces buecherae TaxID=2763006 RepID=UPI0033C8AB1D
MSESKSQATGSEADMQHEEPSAEDVAEGDLSRSIRLSQDRPHSARMYDYFLGGKTNYLVDRQAAEEVSRHFPAVVVAARANRAFMHRSVHYLTSIGIRQFIDIGTGIPTAPNVHEVAQQVAADTRVVYVDNDPIVLAYSEQLLDSTSEGVTRYVEADASDARAVLAAVEATGCVDFTRPVAVNLHALLHFMPDAFEPHAIVKALMNRVVPGSYLSLSHVTLDFEPAAWRAIAEIYTKAGTPAQVRSHAEIARFFDGLEMVDPGLTVAHRWRPQPASGPSLVSDTDVSLYAGVGRKR